MSVWSILFIFIFIIVLVIFLEYRNEKKYQKTRREQRQTSDRPQDSTSPKESEEKPEPRAEPVVEPKPAVKIEPEPEPEPDVEEETEIQEEIKSEPEVETVKETKNLPEANYPQFTHVRLVEMGLSDEEAKEFVAELIPQIEVEIPLIEKAIEAGNFDEIERITHGIKGSASNLGTGGVSDLLADFNTYLKSGTDEDITKAYLKHLIHYTNELKTQYV